MDRRIVFHGASGDRILGIIDSGTINPNISGEIFLSPTSWESVLMYGADTQRKASFAIKLEITLRDSVTTHFVSTEGNPLTLKLETTAPVAAKVLELFARKPGDEGFTLDRVIGDMEIRSYLRK